MKNTTLILIACFWIVASLAALAHPTMAGRVKSYSNGVLTIEQDTKKILRFTATDQTSVKYMGRKTSLAALPAGAKISIEVIGSLSASPLKAGKIVDWGSSAEIVAVGAKAPYHTPVGQYASTNGTGGIPDGAPVGQHAASHTLAAVAHGGAINSPTQANHSVGPVTAPNPNAHSTAGQPAQSTQYRNQGDSMTAPLEGMNISPYGNGQSSSNPGANSSPDTSLGMIPLTNPGMTPGMTPGMDPTMMGMDPSLGMSNPYSDSNLGMGQSGNLMGINGSEDGESSGNDMMGLNDSAYGSGDGKITGSILQVDMQRGLLTIQSFTSPQPQRVIMGPSSSASPDLLIPGKMVEITGHATPNGFQAIEIKAAAGF